MQVKEVRDILAREYGEIPDLFDPFGGQLLVKKDDKLVLLLTIKEDLVTIRKVSLYLVDRLLLRNISDSDLVAAHPHIVDVVDLAMDAVASTYLRQLFDTASLLEAISRASDTTIEMNTRR